MSIFSKVAHVVADNFGNEHFWLGERVILPPLRSDAQHTLAPPPRRGIFLVPV